MKGEEEILKRVGCFDRKEKLEIINHLLDEQEATLESISRKLRMSKSTAYKYLKQMLDAGIVNYRKLPGKKGRLVFIMENPSLSIDEQMIKNVFSEKKKPLVIFDVDDTLVRRVDIPEQLSSSGRNAIKEAMLMLQDKGVAISMPPDELFSAEWIFSKYGNSIEWYMSAWLNISGVPGSEIRDGLVRKHVKEYYRNIEITAPSCRLFSDVKPFLKRFSEKAYFAAISNSSKKTIIESFRNNGILKYFMKDGKPFIVGGDEIPKSRETVEALFRMSGIGAKNSFLVGDSGGDIKAAREAGISPRRSVAVSRGITPIEPLKSIRPGVKIIRSLSELVSIIV